MGVSCDAVHEEMLARIHGQFGTWHDPHNNGTYGILDADKLHLKRLTGDKKYTDKFNFALEPAGSDCTIYGCSESQVTSVADFGTKCALQRLNTAGEIRVSLC